MALETRLSNKLKTFLFHVFILTVHRGGTKNVLIDKIKVNISEYEPEHFILITTRLQ